MKAHLYRLFASTVLALFCGSLVFGEALTGKVLDPDGKAVPNASVRLFDKNSGTLVSTRASAEGIYSFKGVAPGTYLLEGDASNAALSGSKEIAVEGDQNQNLDLKISSR